MHRMWGELRRCEPAPHPPREGPRHVSGWGGVERGRRPSSCRAVRARVRRCYCAVRFAQSVLSRCGRLCVRRPQRAHTIFQIDPQQFGTRKGLFGKAAAAHTTPDQLRPSTPQSTPVPRVAWPQLAARRRHQLGSRSVMLMHGYGIGTVSDMCFATCFISCLRNRLLSSLKGDRGPSLPSAARTAGE